MSRLGLYLGRYRQLATFGVIGVLNTLIHGGVLSFAVEVLAWGVVLAHLLAFMLANAFSYLMNSHWTFKTPLTWARYGRFFLASLLSLALTLILAKAADGYGAHYLVGFALVVVCVPLLSFALMRFWVFSTRNNASTR